MNVRPEIIKLEENVGGKLLDTSFGDDFLNLTPKAKTTKAKINKWGLCQTKQLLQSKGNQQDVKVTC